MFIPPINLEISFTFSSGVNTFRIDFVSLFKSIFSIKMWLSLSEAIWGKWLIEITCLSFDKSISFSPTTNAVLPLIPVSISSKIRVFISSKSDITDLNPSIILEISPPDAIDAIGFKSCPKFVLIRKSNES